jgi:polyisoprenoid-binding protein YceI
MKIFLLRIVTAFSFSICFFCSAYASEVFTIDPSHSFVLWHISHFGFSNPTGKWMVNGSLILDEKKPQESKVNVTIQVGDNITGIPKLDEHLRGKDFFDVSRFPIATFSSNNVVLTSKKSAKVFGTLTVHGISKPVILHVKLNKVAISPIDNKKTIGFTANTTIKRSDFGINTYLPGLGNEVRLDIELEGKLKNNQ